MNNPELKPCPFCGGVPYLANVAMAGCSYVVCTDCRMQSDDGSRNRVVNKWNTRAAPKVKPLVWKNPFCTEGSAAVSFGIYYFMWDEEVQSLYGSLELGECENPIILDPSNCASAQEVMAVCQADYERRILDALE